MIEERGIAVGGERFPVTISDEYEALLAAQAAGRAVVAVIGGSHDFFSGIPYAVEDWAAADDAYLERVVRRHLGLPWIIAETKRLVIREFQVSDAALIPREADESREERIFRDRDGLEAYIRCQYRFYEYGIWALEEKETGALAGMAGVTDLAAGMAGATDLAADGLELGYRLFCPWRGRGLAREACREILSWCSRELNRPIYAKTDLSNERSVRLLHDVGFTEFPQTDKKSAWRWYRYEGNC